MTELKVLTADEQVASILAADARRVRRLTWLTVGLWAPPMAVVLLLGLVSTDLHRRAENAERRYSVMRPPAVDQLDPHYPERWAVEESVALLESLASVGWWLTLAVLLFSLSAFGLLLLVHASRRATLRQIQASLTAIAGQLAEVQTGRGTMPPTAGG